MRQRIRQFLTYLNRDSSFQGRIMRRIAPIVIGSFLVIGVIVAVVRINTLWADLATQHEIGLQQVTGHALGDTLFSPLSNLREMASDLDTRNYADVVLETAPEDSPPGRLQVLTTFIAYLNRERDYTAIRFLTPSGSVWGAVTKREGILSSDTALYTDLYRDDKDFQTALKASVGDAVIGSFSLLTNTRGQVTDDAVLTLYVPVPSVADTQRIVGYIQLEMLGNPILEAIRDGVIEFVEPVDGRRVMLVSERGVPYADSGAPQATNFLLPGVAALLSTEPYATLTPYLNGRLESVQQAGVGDKVITTVRFDPENAVTSQAWWLVFVDNASIIRVPITQTVVGIMLAALLLAVGVLVMIQRLIHPLLRPLTSASTMVQRLASEQISAEGLPVAQGRDEMVGLVLSIDYVSKRIQDLTTNLNRQVNRRTRDLEVAARIGRETATLYDIDVLLERSIELICRELGFYHAQVFLLDDIGENAVLVASRGEVGQQLIEQGHKIPLGSPTVIGQVTGSGKPIVINDTATSEGGPHGFNPLLPKTRAEMGLPLLIGGKVIGALDIQSTNANTFKNEDLATYGLLADQLAVAVHNAQLVTQSDKRIQQIDTLNRRLTRSAWQETGEKIGIKQAFEYNLLDVNKADPDKPAEGLAAPIKIRGEVIGTLTAAMPEGQKFSEGDQVILNAVADRVAYAIENVRLFQETQASLAETSILYQLSRYLNEANTLEDIVQAIVVSVLPDAAGGQIWIFDDHDTADMPEWMELSADLGISERAEGNENLTGARLHLPDHNLFQSLGENQVVLVKDINQDNRLDAQLQDLMQNLGVRAVVFIPLTVRGAWRGLISVGFSDAREFTDREGRIYSALIDQAGVAIDNRLLLRQTEEALARNENLYAASRIINTAQTLQDLVYAAVVTSNDPLLNFRLGLLEGELDESGWPKQVHIVAHSEGGKVREMDYTYDLNIEPDSSLRNREPEAVTDYHPELPAPTPRIEWMREQGIRFLVAFPLFSTSRPIAAFYITSVQIRNLTSEDLEVYRALTGQMSTQLQNRRLLERTEQALDETRRLYIASRAIASAQDSEMVYYAASEHLARPFQRADGKARSNVHIGVLLAGPQPTPDAPYLEYAYVWSNNPKVASKLKVGDRITTQETAFGKLLAASEGALYYSDLKQELANQPELQAILSAGGASSALITPIRSRQKWFGVLLCRGAQARAFDEQYVRFAESIADQVAITIENQQLFEEAQQEARRAQQEAQRALALAEAGQLASSIGADFERNIGEVFNRVAQAANYDRWMLGLLNHDKTRLDVVVLESPFLMKGSEDEVYFKVQPDVHSIVDAVRQNSVVVVNKPAEYPTFMHMDDVLRETVGKHIAIPVHGGQDLLGAVLIGRAVNAEDMDERDRQLVSILAAQVAVALENRRLFSAAETERQTLSSILSTLPAGVLVLDAKTYQPLIYNDKISDLLGREVNRETPFNAADYNLYRTGTMLHYPEDELPIFAALRLGETVFADDVAMIMDEAHTDLLVNAAPVRDAKGDITAIVAAFEDISNLRSLENTLQENLRETVALYEAQRTLSEAGGLDDVLDVLLGQLAIMQPTDAYIALNDERSGMTRVVRQMMGDDAPDFSLIADKIYGGDLVHIEDVRRAPDVSKEARDAVQAAGIHAIMSVPLRVMRREMPLGWLFMVHSDAEGFSPDQERILTTLSDLAATAVDNRLLFQQTEAALQETAALYNATTVVSRSGDLFQLGEAIQAALSSMNPDVYAGYISNAGDITELFNLAMDSAPLNLRGLVDHQLPDEQGVFIEDVTQGTLDELQNDILALGNIRAFAAVNLRIKDMPNGRLFVAYHQPRRWDETDKRFLNAIADAASLRADNVLLFEQIQTTLEETSILYQASRALSDATTPDDIIEVVVNYLIGPHINQVFIALLASRAWDALGATVQITSSWSQEGSLNLHGVALSQEQFPAWSQLATQTVLMIDDIYTDERLDPLAQTGFESLDARSVVVIPLRVAQRAIGAIWLGSQEANTHTDRELRIYQAFAEQASLSMEASHLLEQTDRRARQLETSAVVGERVGRILDLDTLLPELVNLIRDAFVYDHAQVFLMDEADEWALLRASTGEAGRQLLSIGHKLRKGSASIIGTVTSSAKPAIALDTADARVVHQPNPYLPLTRSEMALPLVIKGKVVGALDVQSNQPNAFSDEDVSALTTLAAQIAVAIDNANLYKEAQSRASEMSFLFDVTTAAAASETLNDALQSVANRIQDALSALAVAIYLPQVYADTEENTFVVLKAVALSGSDQPLSEISEVRVDDENNLVGLAAHSMQPSIVEDISQEGHYFPVMSAAQSAIVVPMVSGTELIGLMSIESALLAAFDFSTLQLLLTLSGSLSAVIQNARLLDQLTRTNEQLRELDRLKSDFLANMSHELRTPLNSIIGFSRVMLKGIDGPLTEMQEQDLTTIYNSGQHLLMLINDVLDQAKIASGKMDLKFAYFEVKPLIEGVRSIGIGLLKDKPINLLVEVAPSLPKAYGDEFRSRQVLLNLVSNATKFTQEGQIVVRAYPVTDGQNKTMVRIEVQDSGIGIAEVDMPLLFEAFRQVDSSLTRTVGGTGLGLPIAKSLVEMQGGQMTVTSKVNMGSTFGFTVPVEPTVDVEDEEGKPDTEGASNSDETVSSRTNEQQPPPQQPEKLVTETGKFQALKPMGAGGPPPKIMQLKRQILLIEDNPDMVDQFRRTLQREGFEVLAATIPLEAEAMASGLRPTLIVMDVNFASGKGWDILETLKNRDDTFDIPAIVVTLSDESERAYQLGVHRFIQRPFMPEDLAAAALEAEKESNTDRILIIDDQPDSVRLLTQMLDEHGKYRVFSAQSGKDGVSLVARRRPDLIILDLRMPEMDGFAVLQELRSNPETAKIPVMVVTGDVVNADEQEQLANIHILQKTDISQEEYNQFIDSVKNHLSGMNGAD